MNVHEILGSVWDKGTTDQIGADLHSDLDPGILFLLCLFAICEIALLYYRSLGVSTIMPTILVMSLISVLYAS